MVSDIPDTIQTAYRKRLQYQTIPVDTARLTPGRHTLRVTVANGWYKGALGFVPSPNHYGDRAALLAMLCLDGRTVATGEGWRVTTGPVQRAEFYYGEDYDAAAPAAAPRPPLLPGLDKKNLIAQEDESVRCVQMLPVVKDFLAPNGEWVLDFGQNITGVVHAKFDLPAGAQVRLRHAESLDENGNFYTGNLSFAKSEDTFRSAGQPAARRSAAGTGPLLNGGLYHGNEGLLPTDDASLPWYRSHHCAGIWRESGLQQPGFPHDDYVRRRRAASCSGALQRQLPGRCGTGTAGRRQRPDGWAA